MNCTKKITHRVEVSEGEILELVAKKLGRLPPKSSTIYYYQPKWYYGLSEISEERGCVVISWDEKVE